jgi:hypothetical protein
MNGVLITLKLTFFSFREDLRDPYLLCDIDATNMRHAITERVKCNMIYSCDIFEIGLIAA